MGPKHGTLGTGFLLNIYAAAYLIIVTNASNDVSVKFLKWEDFFPY